MVATRDRGTAPSTSVGMLWDEFRRGIRRGKSLPAGLALCPECAEPRGRARFADLVTAEHVELEISCICDGIPCAWCGQMPVHRPGGNRYDSATAAVRHVPIWASAAPCPPCRADGAAAPPQASGPADHVIGATPFYGEAPPSSEYFGSRRYRAFGESLARLADRHGVQLLAITPVQGIWCGRHEPSALISVHGDAECVLVLMADLADTWGQECVLCFSPDPAGDARLHHGSTPCGVEEICSLLGDDGPAAIKVGADGEVTILDIRGDRREHAHADLTRLGAPGADVHGHGFIHLRLDVRSP